jgi:hypothetical protein
MFAVGSRVDGMSSIRSMAAESEENENRNETKEEIEIIGTPKMTTTIKR